MTTRNKRELILKLEIKLQAEYEKYKSNTLKQDKTTIFDKSYETNIKSEIKNFLITMSYHFSSEELSSLSNFENLIDNCYFNWIHYDSPFSTQLEDSVFESVGKVFNKDKEYNER